VAGSIRHHLLEVVEKQKRLPVRDQYGDAVAERRPSASFTSQRAGDRRRNCAASVPSASPTNGMPSRNSGGITC
jgi:hypothetical protein